MGISIFLGLCAVSGFILGTVKVALCVTYKQTRVKFYDIQLIRRGGGKFILVSFIIYYYYELAQKFNIETD